MMSRVAAFEIRLVGRPGCWTHQWPRRFWPISGFCRFLAGEQRKDLGRDEASRGLAAGEARPDLCSRDGGDVGRKADGLDMLRVRQNVWPTQEEWDGVRRLRSPVGDDEVAVAEERA